MKITSVRIKKNNKENEPLLGIANIQLDDCLVIHDIKLVQLENGKRIISFPNKKVKRYTIDNGDYEESYEYSDIVHPSNKEFRAYIEAELFKIYDKETRGDINE